MNIYVLLKRTFDTEEKIPFQTAKLMKMVLNLSLTRTMSMQWKKLSRCVMHRAAK